MTNNKKMKTFVFSLGLVTMMLTANNLNAQNEGGSGLFGRGESSTRFDHSSNSRGMMNVTGIPGNSEEGISNYGIGEEVPLGSGLVILLGAGLGYVALKKKEDEQ